MNVCGTEDDDQLEVIPTQLKDDVTSDDDCDLINDFEQQIHETNNTELIKDYGQSTKAENYRLYAFAVSDGTVEYSFSKFHPYDTVIHGLMLLKQGFDCKSWREIVLEKITENKLNKSFLLHTYIFLI